MTDEATTEPEKKRVHRRTQYERLQLQLQSKQNVVDKDKTRVKARLDDLEQAQRELFVSEQELDLIGRMLELAKAQQELAVAVAPQPPELTQ